MLIKLNDATATSAMEGFSAALNRMPLAMCKSMTYDQGREMARHAEITQQTGVAIYFCDPHCPWQRDSKRKAAPENINGLIRQPSQKKLDAIALQLKMRPRKRFDFKYPIEVMGKVCRKAWRCGMMRLLQFNNGALSLWNPTSEQYSQQRPF